MKARRLDSVMEPMTSLDDLIYVDTGAQVIWNLFLCLLMWSIIILYVVGGVIALFLKKQEGLAILISGDQRNHRWCIRCFKRITGYFKMVKQSVLLWLAI